MVRAAGVALLRVCIMALTGFLVNIGGGSGAICSDSAAHAIDAIGARFPYVAGSNPVLCNLESSVFTAPNTFTNTIMCHDLTGGMSWTLAHSLHLSLCDPALPIGGGSVLDVINSANVLANFTWGFAAMVLFFFWGFVISTAIMAIKKA